MPDRLAELRRQRALLEEHLAWLDREIARETHGLPHDTPAAPRAAAAKTSALESHASAAATFSQTRVTSGSAGAATTATVPEIANANAGSGAAANRDIDAMLEQYRVPTHNLRTDVRKGCFLYFAAALVFVALVVTVLYFALTPR